MRKTIRKSEIIIFAVLLIGAAIAWIVMNRQRESVDHGSIHITIAGEDFGTFPLNKDQVINIGDTNTCRVQDGQVKMIEADCPDHLCISQMPIDEKGGFIICLPNQVIIEGIPAEDVPKEQQLDGIAQ